MSTKEPIGYQARQNDLPGWQLYSELFDSDHVYLELEGVAAEIIMTGNVERKPGTVRLRLPIVTAKQLHLVPGEWENGRTRAQSAPAGEASPGPLARMIEPTRQAGSVDLMDEAAASPGRKDGSALLDRYLEELRCVLIAAASVSGDMQAAINWFRNSGLAPFSGKTAQEVMADGRTRDLLRYIDSLHAGFAG